MKKTIFSIMCAATMLGAAVIGWQISQNQKPLTEAMLANIEALTYIEIIDGNIVIIDEIPCASSANEYEIWASYVNCADCKSQRGRATDLTCTVVRQ